MQLVRGFPVTRIPAHALHAYDTKWMYSNVIPQCVGALSPEPSHSDCNVEYMTVTSTLV